MHEKFSFKAFSHLINFFLVLNLEKNALWVFRCLFIAYYSILISEAKHVSKGAVDLTVVPF